MKPIRISRAVRSGFMASLIFSGLAFADLTVVQIAPLSGPLADTGKLTQQGASLAIRSANDKGGIHGQKIRFVVKDDSYKVDETVRLFRETAAQEKPVAYIGLVGTGNVKALLDKKLIDEAGIPVIGVRTGAGSLRHPANPLVYHLRASYATEVDKLVEVVASIGGRKFGVMYQNDPFGEDGLAGLTEALTKRQLTLAASASYEKNTTDVNNAVSTLLKAGELSSIILISNTKATTAFIKTYRKQGGIANIYTISVNNDREIVAAIGAEQALGLGLSQVVPFPFSAVLPVVREYQSLLQKYAPETQPTVTGLEGFIYGKVLVEALRRAGPHPGREALTSALERAPFELGGFVIDFSGANRHEGSLFVELTMIGRTGKLIH